MKKTNNRMRQNRMLKALEKTMGVVTQACKMADVPRTTHYEWIGSDQEYRKKVKAIEDVALDFVESKHYKLIEEKNTASIIFHLKTKGRKRGYQENAEIVEIIKENPIVDSLNVEGKKELLKIANDPKYQKDGEK